MDKRHKNAAATQPEMFSIAFANTYNGLRSTQGTKGRLKMSPSRMLSVKLHP